MTLQSKVVWGAENEGNPVRVLPKADRRGPARDRRLMVRGGRRRTDLPLPCECPRCHSKTTGHRLKTGDGKLWCYCITCAGVWHVEPLDSRQVHHQNEITRLSQALRVTERAPVSRFA